MLTSFDMFLVENERLMDFSPMFYLIVSIRLRRLVMAAPFVKRIIQILTMDEGVKDVNSPFDKV